MSKEHISYPLAKRLHDKGFATTYNKVWVTRDMHGEILTDRPTFKDVDVCNAYTFTELWGAMPNILKLDTGVHSPQMTKGMISGHTGIEYAITNIPKSHISFWHESPAEAAGMMVEWLIDNGYMEVSQ